MKAQSALSEGKWDEAERLYTELLNDDPELVDALLHRAFSRMRGRKWQAALVDAKKASELHPESSFGLMLQGEILLELKDSLAAYECLKRANEIEPDNGRAAFQLGRAAMALGRKEEAADFFEHALQFERDYCMAQLMAQAFSKT